MKKTKNYITQKKKYLIVCFLPYLAMATDSFGDDTNDITPAAPIHNYMKISVCIGLFIAFYFLKKQQLQKKTNN